MHAFSMGFGLQTVARALFANRENADLGRQCQTETAARSDYTRMLILREPPVSLPKQGFRLLNLNKVG